jgi:hypothetical protein
MHAWSRIVGSLGAGEMETWVLPLSFEREHSSANTLILTSWDLLWASDLQNCRVINLHFCRSSLQQLWERNALLCSHFFIYHLSLFHGHQHYFPCNACNLLMVFFSYCFCLCFTEDLDVLTHSSLAWPSSFLPALCHCLSLKRNPGGEGSYAVLGMGPSHLCSSFQVQCALSVSISKIVLSFWIWTILLTWPEKSVSLTCVRVFIVILQGNKHSSFLCFLEVITLVRTAWLVWERERESRINLSFLLRFKTTYIFSDHTSKNSPFSNIQSLPRLNFTVYKIWFSQEEKELPSVTLSV